MIFNRQSIDRFIKNNPINPGWVNHHYKIEIEEKEDGDEWVEVKLPMWSNDNVIKDVLTFALRAARRGASVYSGDNYIKVFFYTHACNPD